MNGFLFLLYCIEILAALLSRAQANLAVDSGSHTDQNELNQSMPLTVLSSTSSGMAVVTSVMSSQSSTPPARFSKSPSTSQNPQPSTPDIMFYMKECAPVLMVTGGLIIACSILLVSTLLLACKVCQFSKRIKVLSNNVDQNSYNEHWMGSAKKNKSKSETEPKETSVLMADVSQTQEEMSNGTADEEGGKVNEDGQVGDENKTEVGDTGNNVEASTTPGTVPEISSSSEPQEEATDSQPTKVAAAPTSEGTEEPKDVV